jgi:V/A-type H+-transporting ATPase subunit B
MKEYATIRRISGPLAFVERTDPIGYGELVRIRLGDEERMGQVLDTSRDLVVVQLFEPTSGLHRGATVRFLGEGVLFGVAPEILGRVFDGRGRPRDGGAPILPERRMPIHGLPINPVMRERPHEPIQTGISGIDLANTLLRGQKLPIFSGAGLPHDTLAMQLARQATVRGGEERFVIVFAGIGVPEEQARLFLQDITTSGALPHSVLFLNTAADPVIERLLVPRLALTAAEYLAFERGMHVLVILDDMTNYADALREVAAAREEMPGRRGYPGYLYTDLATLYERAGIIKGKKGSITTVPVLTLPGDDITHPIPDLTGYITEGQVVLSRELHNKGIYPPIDILQSLSRLMGSGIGAGRTRKDHKPVSDQVFACYADGIEARSLVSIMGEDALGDDDRAALAFAQQFESGVIGQEERESRTFEETLELAWKALAAYPSDRLRRIPNDMKQERMRPQDEKGR